MILRLLFWVMVVLGLSWLFRKTGQRTRRPARHIRSAGVLVRDPVCRTFLPKDKALQLATLGGNHYFCSPACRSQFQNRKTQNGPPARDTRAV